MASNYTSNYNLNQWSASDRVLRTEFNADNAKIDAAVKAVDRRVDSLNNSKASASALANLEAVVDGLKTSKADKTALDALKNTVNKHTTTLTGKGNCQLYTTSYTGTGTNGAKAPNSLTFPYKPLVVFLAGVEGMQSILVQGQNTGAAAGTGNGYILTITWSGNSVSWSNFNSAFGQMNETGETYVVVALLKAGG